MNALFDIFLHKTEKKKKEGERKSVEEKRKNKKFACIVFWECIRLYVHTFKYMNVSEYLLLSKETKTYEKEKEE